MKKVVAALKIVAVLIALYFAYTSFSDLWYVVGHYLEMGHVWSSESLAIAMIKATIAIVFAILSK